MSQRDLAHVLTALAVASHGEAGVGVPVGDVDEAIGRSGDDMRTPLNLASLRDDGLVEESAPGVWALTDAGVDRLREDAELDA